MREAHTPGRLPWAALVPRRAFAIGAALCVAAALAAGALPILEVPGFEVGLAASLAAALLLGPTFGIAAARRAPAAPLRAFAAAACAVSALLGLALAAAALRAWLLSPCRPLASAPLFALVAFPSGLLAAAVAVLAATLARGRRRRAALLYGAAAAASLAATLTQAYLGPAASAHDHLLGVWPGPLYDEALEAGARLVLFRAGTLAWAIAAVALAALVIRRRAGAPLPGPAIALVAALAAAGAARLGGGGDASRAELAERLGGLREGPRCTVHFAREKRPSEAERILRDCEYDAAEIAAALGLAHPPRATVWIYRSPAEKRSLVGAGHTSYTKPWLAEVHVNDAGTPHPVLRHELVHALAAAAASGPLRVPARAGVVVNLGLVEGLAVALEAPRPGEGLHAWTRALRDGGRLPPLASLMHGGFLGAAPARAYTAAGSFLRFLIERHGPAKVLAAYREDDVAAALGRPLTDLGAEWNRFLDGVAVPAPLAAAAEVRFASESIFSRRCAREVADDEARAAALAAAGRAERAEALLRRARALSGGDPAFLRPAADAWRSAGDRGRAAALYREALAAADA
ncbi:MAG: type VI secretion system protein, partial [Anaeromyxobacteraceae bacterium]